MKLIIFSTRTKHHLYYINKIYQHFPVESVIFENKRLQNNYKTGPFFDQEQDEYEENFFNDGVTKNLPKKLEKNILSTYDVNQKEICAYLKKAMPDIIIIFGTGIISSQLLNIAGWAMINLHGGLTQYYRGLDSTLWALYFRDFDKLGVTIHYVEPGLDEGGILSQKNIPIEKSDKIYHFRYKITKQATEMSLELLDKFSKQKDRLKSIKMYPRGKYFSAMDLERKFVALRNLTEYQGRL